MDSNSGKKERGNEEGEGEAPPKKAKPKPQKESQTGSLAMKNKTGLTFLFS